MIYLKNLLPQRLLRLQLLLLPHRLLLQLFELLFLVFLHGRDLGRLCLEVCVVHMPRLVLLLLLPDAGYALASASASASGSANAAAPANESFSPKVSISSSSSVSLQ